MKLYKNILASVFLLLSTVIPLQARTAILMAHYGSSDDDTRCKTIDIITTDVQGAFPELEVVEAYISSAVRDKLHRKGLDYPSPNEALARLHALGCDTVIVQSSTLLEGAEMAEVRNAVRESESLFKEIRVGRPLCFSPEDCEEVVNLLAESVPDEHTAIIYVGHGNNLPSTATYSQLDHMIHARGIKDIHVSTIEGYPTAKATVGELRHNPKIERVELRPLLLVCGNHTKADIAGEFADILGEAGYSTEVIYQGLAENPGIRRIYVRRIAELLATLDP